MPSMFGWFQKPRRKDFDMTTAAGRKAFAQAMNEFWEKQNTRDAQAFNRPAGPRSTPRVRRDRSGPGRGRG